MESMGGGACRGTTIGIGLRCATIIGAVSEERVDIGP